ncbi:hypothetical protein LCGC14_1382060 [marine sediment metagenome]|uniref:Uncharacterized protein n=1 Tax=marine sediment metagenome TaxID=412755 RepID=A0A0F9N449_9ZZZZ
MEERIVGIDPGLGGAVAFIMRDDLAVVDDVPVIQVGKKREYNAPEMAEILRCWSPDHVYIEKVHSMPKQGVASSFNFGKGFGLWLGIVATLGIPYTLVTPQRWKGKMLDGQRRGKGDARLRATQLFPELASSLTRVKDDGRAEALLIAAYGRLTGTEV